MDLKPCPACGGVGDFEDDWIGCQNNACFMQGPSPDSDGSRWNALRRDDKAVGMSDGELIARAIIYGTELLAMHRQVTIKPSGSFAELSSAIIAELVRREKLRSDAK